MAHFAEVKNGIVTQVIVADQEFVNSLQNPNDWIQTSYNTHGGIHYGPDGQPDGKPQLRKNFAGIGHFYDPQRDAFIAPSPFPSWVLNEETCIYEAPVPYPDDGRPYKWDEAITDWVLDEEVV